MRNRSIIGFQRILACGALSLLIVGLQLHAQTTMVVSIPSLHLHKNERIVGFELRVRSGRIAQLPNVPIGWSVSVDNDPSWDTSMKGSIAVGAAALSLDSFQHFVIVEAEKDPDTPFVLRGEVIVTTDFLTTRTIKLSPKDFGTEVRDSIHKLP